MDTMRHSRPAALALLALAAAGAAPLSAQGRLREVREWGSAGGALVLADPVGYMGSFVNLAGGADGFLTVNLIPGGALGLRFEGSWLAHQLSVGYGAGFVLVDAGGGYGHSGFGVDVRTTSASYVASLRAGPQITLGGDGARLYGILVGGPSYFGTFGSFTTYDCGCGYYWPGYSETWILSGDWAWGWQAGGGIQLRLGGRHAPTYLDLGARYVHHGDARYLVGGPSYDGLPTWVALRGPAELVVFRIGVSVGLR